MNKIFLLIGLVLLSSCRYGISYSELTGLEEAKNQVVQIQSQNLSEEDHEALKTYFGSVKNLAFELKQDIGMRNYFHRKFFSYFRPDSCEKLLLSQETYQSIMSKCEVNDFFVCSEDVKYYQEILFEVKKYLTELEITNLKKDPECLGLMSKLGVVNE